MYYSYKYRFQAPDSYYYDVSWSEFFNEKLENYNWNYLDQYICTRGEGDYGLMDVSILVPHSPPPPRELQLELP